MKNSLAGRILAMVLLGISLIAVIVSTVVLSMSRKVFTETYGQSQEKVFSQVENELNDFHTSLQKMTDAIDSSWAFRLFLDSQEKSDNTLFLAVGQPLGKGVQRGAAGFQLRSLILQSQLPGGGIHQHGKGGVGCSKAGVQRFQLGAALRGQCTGQLRGILNFLDWKKQKEAAAE